MLKFFNTLRRRKEEFKPLTEDFVGIYTCGPTVYDYAHIGNFKTYVFQDILRRYLRYKGFKLKQVMNITDVDDKTIKGSRKEGIPLKEYTERYAQAFFEDLEKLNIEKVEVYPRATEHIQEMVALIQKLMEKGIAYKGDDGSIYYNIRKFKDYGKLSRLKLNELKGGARVSHDTYDKKQVADFALWKAWDENDGEVFWETPLGKGRPGWHIECSAMSLKYLGETFDIHSGGVDLIFPHHENEIAQSERATGKEFARYWVHGEHLLVEGRKMSKSLGNFYTLRDILAKGYSPKGIRWLLMSGYYRQQLNFTLSALEAAEKTAENFICFYLNLKEVKTKGKQSTEVQRLVEKTQRDFENAMDDDLNMPSALSAVFELVKESNKLLAKNKLSETDAKAITLFLEKINKVLGILGYAEEKQSVEKELKKFVEKKIKEREEARRKKNFKKADGIREELKKKGIVLEDTKDGVKWRIG
ncbi:cysteine--tRNA ligase [Candidatus Micrarchaeota archaeon]|nr:cysteine--tRNA ligase [Candidatus Micrarchaeota archaeon]